MKQVLNFVKLFLVILLVSLTSCTNDLSEKNKEISFSFELPQEKINRATNENSDNTLWNINAQIENTKEIIQKIEKTAYSGETVTLTFKEIIVGQEVKINIDLTKKDEKTPTYTGSSDWFIVKNGNNKINLKLNKVEENTPQIIDATIPKIITQPQSIVEIATPNSTTITKTLSVSAKSTDNGTLSFIWQEKNSDNTWQKFEPITTTPNSDKIESSIKVTVEKGNSKTFKCIITNTNNLVNGITTATVETNLVTVAYVEGDLTSITATYKSGEHQILGQEFNYSKVTIAETYTKDNTTPPPVTVEANSSRYTISPTKDYEKAIGYVPYTVKYNGNTNISTEIRVPVKYELKAEDFSITSDTNQSETNAADNPEKIPQFTGTTVLTVGSKGETSGVPLKIYQDNNSNSSIDYDIMSTGVTSSWKKDSSAYANTTSISVDNRNQGTSTYNATITPISNSWCFGNSITLNYYIQVCPWKIALNTEDENTNLTNLTGNTEYTLSATNEADTTSTVIWSSNNTRFTINNNTLTTPQASTSDQTATITAKVDGKVIGSVEVTVQGIPLGSSQVNPFTLWSDLKSYLENNSSDKTEIYVRGNFEATSGITVNRPVTIIPVGEVTITLYDNFSEQLFTVNADLTLKGYDASNQFTIDGNGYKLEVPLISTDNSDITLEYVTMKNYTNYPEDSSTPEGSAISFNCTDKTLSLKNCNFTDVITTIMPNKEFKTQIGAIYFGNGTLILDNCSFTDEYAHLYCYPDDTSKITLKGNITLPIIQYANAFTYWNGDLQITLEEDTFQSDEIKIYVDNIIDGYDTKLFTLNDAELPKCFKLLNEDYEFDYTNGKIVATTGSGGGSAPEPLQGYSVRTATDLKTAVESGTEEVIIIANDITLTECINISREVTIAANSAVTLTSNISDDNVFYLSSSLTLGGGTGTLTIKAPNTNYTVIATTTNPQKNITIKNGVHFTNCSYYCLSLSGKDTLNIEGGTFSNNNTRTPIYINNTNATVNITGGTISNNNVSSDKGAGIVVNSGTLNITGGTMQNNVLKGTDSGASIFVSSTGTATVNDSTLTKNAHYTKTIIDGVEQ